MSFGRSLLFNAFILVVLFVPILRGYLGGFVRSALHLFRHVIALLLSFFLARTFFSGATSVIAFVMLFLLTFVFLRCMTPLLSALIEKIPLVKQVNRIFGLFLGLLLGVLNACLLSRIFGFFLPRFTSIDISQSSLISFFSSLQPFRWFFECLVGGRV